MKHLAATAFFGGGAEDADLEVDLVGDRSEGQPGPDGCGRDDVVTAGVADVRQGVVFRAHCDDQVPVARPRLQGGLEVIDPFADRESSVADASATAAADRFSWKHSSGVAWTA